MIRVAYSALAVAGLSFAFAACGSSEDTTVPDPGAAIGTDPTRPAPTPTTTPPAPPDQPPVPVVPKAVRFIAMGDTGTASAGQVKIASAIAAKCKTDGCDFVQLLGDNLYDSGASSVDDPIWQEKFEVPYAAIELDFFAVLGNHDYGAGGAGTDFARGKHEVDYTMKSQKWKMPAPYFHFAKENVEIFALDTNMAFFNLASAQKNDVTAWLATSKAEWKIAVGHHPFKSNGPHGNAGNYDNLFFAPVNGANVESFLNDTICGKADVYFCGHDHSRQWLNESCKGTELAVSGAGAKATELKGNNPTLFQSIELGFLYVVIQGKKLTAEFVDENGNVEFTHVITKP